jgi:dTDP-4-dehydrorhamnose 3,5-epimerase-like enzyme
VQIPEAALPEIKVIMPQRIGDARGFFPEVWNAPDFASVGSTPLSYRTTTSATR